MTRFIHRSLAASQQVAVMTAPTGGAALGRGDHDDGIVRRHPDLLTPVNDLNRGGVAPHTRLISFLVEIGELPR